MKVFSRLWADEAGFILSSESVLIATVVVIGLLGGLTSVRDQVVQELGDVGAAIAALNQSYSFSAITAHQASTAGSSFEDMRDDCDTTLDNSGEPPLCISVSGGATKEANNP